MIVPGSLTPLEKEELDHLVAHTLAQIRRDERRARTLRVIVIVVAMCVSWGLGALATARMLSQLCT